MVFRLAEEKNWFLHKFTIFKLKQMKEMKVKDIMTSDVIVCEAKTPVKTVAQKLVRHNITGMPVVKGDEIIGIITEGDVIMQKAKLHIPNYINVLSSFLYLEDPAEVEEELRRILGMEAEQLMTKEVITIGPEESVEELATIFEHEHVNPIPVVSDDKLVGIVSRSDIVKLLVRDL